MADKPKTVPDSPPADQTADIAQSEAYETANVVSATAPEAGPTFGARKSPDELGTLGPYRVLRELGRGGMGAVYLGFDERLKRKVALKVMLPKYAAVASSKNRFLREARAAAGITHDHIVTIYEADEHGGTPFMAMQLLQGYPLDIYLKKNPKLPLGELLRIGREMALGLAAAHSVGLIHRDIKPGNIWLEAPNGRVKILDFGLAKPTEDQKIEGELTATGVIVGTPAYMPPEQARGAKADFRADLFSLGVVLYRLATGTMPFHGDTMMAMLAAVIADDPPPVRELNPDIPEPLAKLIHEMLEKKPQNRPKSADEVAERLQQIQLGTAAAISLPMQVIPLDALPTTTYAASSAPIDPFAELDTEPNEVVTRHNSTRSLPAIPAAAKKPLPKWPLIALGLFLLVVAALIPQIISIMTPKGTLVIESTDPDVEITVKQGGATIVDKSKGREFVLKVGDDYTIDMVEKDGLKLNVNKFEITRNNKSTVRVVVQRPPPKPKVEPPPSAIPSAAPIVPLAWQGPSPLDALDPARIPASEKLDWQPKELVGVLGTHAARHWGQGWALAISPDGQTIATGGTDNTIRLWDATTLQPRGEIAGLNAVARRIAFSKDGRQFLTLATVDSIPEFVLCDVTKKTVVERLAPKVKESQLDGIPFIAPDGRLLAATHKAPKYDGSVRVIDLKTGALVVELKGHPATGYIWTALSPDGTRFATLHSGHVQLWDAKTGNRLHSWNEMKPGGDNWLAFSPDGKWIAASSGGPNDFIDLHVWDAASGKSVLHKKEATRYYGPTVAFSRDSGRILIGGASAGISVVEVQSGAIAAKFVPDSVSLHEAVFNADGSRVVTFGTHYGVGGDGVLRSYDAKTGQPAIPLPTGPIGPITSIALSNDLTQLFTLGADRTVRVWDSRTLQATTAFETTPQTYSTPKMALLPDGKRLVVVEKSVVIRDRSTGALLETLSPEIAGSVVVSPDGRTVVFGTQAGKIVASDITATPAKKLWDYSAHDAAVHTVAFSPDGRRLATGGNDHRAFIWDVTGKEPKKLCEAGAGGIQAGDENVYRIVWTPDGKSMVATRGQRVQVWRVSDKTAVLQDSFVVAGGGTYLSKGMSLHPSLPWVAVATDKDRGSVALWDYTTKTKLKEWSFPVAPTALEFAPDGRHLLTANPNGTIGVLRLDVPKAAADPNAPKLEFAAEWPGNRDPLPATEFVPAWNAPGVLAEVRGRGTIRFPRVEAKEFALDLELDLRGTGELSVQLGDSSDFRPELRLWEENGVGFARMVRVQNGKFFARATQAKIDRNCRLTLVASPAGTGLARGDGDVFRVTPASANATIQFTGRADTTNSTIRSVRVRPATKLELANLAAKLGGAVAPETPGEDPTDPDRALADWVLRLKGTVYVLSGGSVQAVSVVSDLPTVPFATLRIELPNGAAVTDAEIVKTVPDKKLLVAILTGTPVGDATAAHLATIPTLTDVHLANTNVTDAGAIKLAGLPKLNLCTLANTKVTNASAKAFAKHPTLFDLNLHNTAVDDDAVAALSSCPKLATLHLSSTKITDKGLTALEACPSLRHLTLGKTAVTDAGVKKLAAALPLCKIEWDGGVIEPRASQTRGLAFDGKSTYVKIPTALGGSEFPYTIEAWITPETVTGKSRHLFLFGEPGGGIGLSEKGSFGIGFKSPKEWVSDYGRSTLKPGERVHVAAVATASQFELFLNGRSDGIKIARIGSLVGITPPALIGKHTKDSPEGYFHGTMHALRVSKSVRYTKPFAPENAWKPDADTVAQYHFDEGTGTKLTDHSGNGHHGIIENGTWVK